MCVHISNKKSCRKFGVLFSNNTPKLFFVRLYQRARKFGLNKRWSEIM